MAPGLGRSRICGGLSLLWSAIKKSKPLFGVCCSCEKKRSLCARATGFFLLPPQAVFAFVGDTRGAIINDVMFLRGVKGVCFKENPHG